MTSRLKAILEEMGASEVFVGDEGIGFNYGGRFIHISGGIEDFEHPIVDVDITEAGG